jgi:hypothetical protein
VLLTGQFLMSLDNAVPASGSHDTAARSTDGHQFHWTRELTRCVHTDGCVDANHYSVPWRLIRETVTVQVRDDQLRLRHAGMEIAQQRRRRTSLGLLLLGHRTGQCRREPGRGHSMPRTGRCFKPSRSRPLLFGSSNRLHGSTCAAIARANDVPKRPRRNESMTPSDRMSRLPRLPAQRGQVASL